MKTIAYIVLFALLAGGVQAQENLSLAMADKAYDAEEYSLAARLYEKVEHYHSLRFYKLPVDIPSRLAHCYRVLNDYKDAARWYKRITDQAPVRAEDWVGYGDALKSLGQYADAKVAYRHVPDSLYNRIRDRVDGCDSALVWMTAPAAYSVSNLAAVNTSGSDWGAVAYGRSVVFTSDSGRTTDNSRNAGFFAALGGFPTGGPYQKVYVLDSGGVSGFSPVVNNERYHDGAVTFDRTGDTAWFSVTNTAALKDPGDKIQYKQGLKTVTINIRRLELWWTAKDSSGGWGMAHPFAYNNSALYSIGQAAISGPVLYFASDMPGGYGKSDIWYCLRQADGSWSVPVNCGPAVNTAEEDAFPYIGPDGTLYFASKGHVGMGGFDVFRATGSLSSWSDVRNLGYPLNSSGDDFYFTMRGTSSGYVSSDRPGGSGSDDIYEFDVLKLIFPVRSGADLTYTEDAPGGEPAHVALVVNVPEEVVIAARTPVKKMAPAPGDSGGSEPGDAPGGAPRPEKSAAVAPDPAVAAAPDPVDAAAPSPAPGVRHLILRTRVFDKLTGEPLAGAQVKVTGDKRPTITGKTGVVYRVIAPGSRYIDSAFKESYSTGEVVVSTEGGTTDTVTLEMYLLKAPTKGDVFVLHNVYFDLDKATIRADAAAELDRVVAYMKQFPNISIDLSAHTDSRGNDAYNMALSIRRARSARYYLYKHGIAYSRMTAHGYGETRLVNGCKNDVPCTDEQHQENRRVEVKVLKS
ncbi:OmpA family protein [Dinghuibacter silviterrae]|uniref:OmpA family protein n=1 Tax=Dinghuibacter silviterrae TaxID=1539049 RepID=A0A4R8DWW7_9BACT|nr:OmpA family protein [Dinghuibacter silviterrae]TDX02025.1 OmpA family protein [Dinghuibacter silviterrae]